MNDHDIRARARRIIDQAPMSVLTTLDEGGYPQSRTMWTPAVDDDFTVYFVTGRILEKCRQISANPRVCCFWTQIEDNALGGGYVCIKGEARVTDEQQLRDRLWDDVLSQYFPGGKTDPNYVVVVVKPSEMTVMDNMQSHQYPLDRLRF